MSEIITIFIGAILLFSLLFSLVIIMMILDGEFEYPGPDKTEDYKYTSVINGKLVNFYHGCHELNSDDYNSKTNTDDSDYFIKTAIILSGSL